MTPSKRYSTTVFSFAAVIDKHLWASRNNAIRNNVATGFRICLRTRVAEPHSSADIDGQYRRDRKNRPGEPD